VTLSRITVPSIPEPKEIINNGHWSFPEQMGGKHHGFIYIIRDKVLRRFYLGKKNFYGAGAANRGVESQWKTYKSSSNSLSAHFKERPYYEEFDFICIEQYKTRGTLSYSETWSLCCVEAPTNNLWYNRLIEKVSWNVTERITHRHKDRLNRAIEWESFNEGFV
jgi:Putative endonuclease segE, GIY-YIG domain